MFASVTTTRGPNADDMVDVAAMAGETMLGWLKDVEGFRGIVMLSSEESGRTHVITFWENEEVAERSRVSRLQLRDRIVAAASVEVEDTQPFVVAFADLGGFATIPPR